MTAAVLALLLLHESGVSSSRLELRGAEARVTFTFSLEDLAGLARLDLDRNGTVDAREWTAVLPGIVTYLGSHFQVRNGDERCAGERDPEVLPPPLSVSEPRAPVTLRLIYRSSRPFDRAAIRCDLFREHGGNPRHLAETEDGGTIVFDNDRSEAEISGKRSAGMLPWGAGGGAAALALALTLVALRRWAAAAAAA